MTTPKATRRPLPKLVPVEKLHVAEWNPRTITNERLVNLRKSIREDPQFLWHRPILAVRDGTVYAGNMRLRAAIAEGWKAVPAIVENITLEQARRRALQDNGQWGEWHTRSLAELIASMKGDRSTLGFDPGELERLLALVGAAKADADEDKIPEPPARPITRAGDIIELGAHRLICGDSRQAATWKALVGQQQADAMWTDPPYGVDLQVAATASEKRGGSGRTVAAMQGDRLADLAPLLRDVFTNANAHLRPGASWYIAGPHGPQLGTFIQQAEAVKWTHQQTLVWVKNAFTFGRSHYHYQHEAIMYGSKPGPGRVWNGLLDESSVIDDEPKLSSLKLKDAIALIKELRVQLRTDVVREDKPRANDLHPTMKPVALIRRMLTNSTLVGALVVEPFGGSGSTLIACEQLGRRAAVIELEPRFCDVIVKRWEELTGKKAKRPARRKAA